MVHAEELTRSFGTLKALDRVSLTVRPGEVFGLLGPNGAGKTTLVRILTGVLRPHGGKAQVAGLDVARAPHRVKARIGYATQEQSVYRDLTVEENLLFRARLYRPGEARALAEEALLRFGLRPYAKTLAGHLSGGWRQRLALAQAVVHRPEVLFLDEPTTGLDLFPAGASGTSSTRRREGGPRSWSPPTTWTRPSAATAWPFSLGGGSWPRHPPGAQGLGPGAGPLPLRPGPLLGGPPGASGGSRGLAKRRRGQAHRPALLSPRAGVPRGGAQLEDVFVLLAKEAS